MSNSKIISKFFIKFKYKSPSYSIIKGSALLLALFVLIFAFTIIIILYLINKRYIIYAKAERNTYKATYDQKKRDILNYLIQKSIKEFYTASILYNYENIYNKTTNTLETFYSTIKLDGTMRYLYMLYGLYSNSSTYYIDFNLYGYDTTTTIYATAKNVDISQYLIYNNSSFKFKDFLSKNSLNPLEKEIIKNIIETNKKQIETVFKDLGNVTFPTNYYLYDKEIESIGPQNLSITKNIKNITIYFYVNQTPYKLLIKNTKIQTSISNEIDLNTSIDSLNNYTIVYPYMNSHIKTTLIKSESAQIVKM